MSKTLFSVSVFVVLAVFSAAQAAAQEHEPAGGAPRQLFDLPGHDSSGHTGPVLDLDFSPDGKQLVTCGADMTIRVWDATTGKLQTTFELNAGCVRWLKDGQTIAVRLLEVKDESYGIVLIDSATGKLLKMLASPNERPGNENRTYSAVTELADGSLAAGNRTRISLWKMPGASFQAEMKIETGKIPLTSLAVSSDRKRLATGDGRMFDLKTGKQIGETIDTVQWAGTRLATFSPDSKSVALLDNNFTLKVLSADSGEEIREIESAARSFAAVSYSPGGKYLVVSRQGTFTIYSATTGTIAMNVTTKNRARRYSALAISPDGTRLAIGGEGELQNMQNTPALEIWDISAYAEKLPTVPVKPAGAIADSTPSERKLRKWTSVDGNFSVEAQFLRLLDNQVELKTKDGRTIKVPLDKLSERDREYATSPD